jgi:hypothetical protein
LNIALGTAKRPVAQRLLDEISLSAKFRELFCNKKTLLIVRHDDGPAECPLIQDPANRLLKC